MLDNHSQILIKLHHVIELLPVFYKAKVPSMGSKFLHTDVIDVFDDQSINNLFKI